MGAEPKVDEKAREVSFLLPKKLYSRQALEIAAQVFSARADVLCAETRQAFDVTLAAKRKASADDLESLAGEFFNECLNQEYRFLVGGFNQKLAGLTVTQALFSARGGQEKPPSPPAEEQTPEFKAEVERLMAQAKDEIARTMPKRIAPQGSPIPPEEPRG